MWAAVLYVVEADRVAQGLGCSLKAGRKRETWKMMVVTAPGLLSKSLLASGPEHHLLTMSSWKGTQLLRLTMESQFSQLYNGNDVTCLRG